MIIFAISIYFQAGDRSLKMEFSECPIQKHILTLVDIECVILLTLSNLLLRRIEEIVSQYIYGGVFTIGLLRNSALGSSN